MTPRKAAAGLLMTVALAAAPAAGAAPVRVGIEAGVLSARFADGSAGSPTISRDPRRAWGGAVELFAEHSLPGPFALVAGVGYAEPPDVAHVQDHEFLFFNGGQAYEFTALWTIRQHVLTVPLRLEYRRGPFRAGAGPQARYLVSAWRTGSDAGLAPVGGLVPSSGRRSPAPAAQIFEEVGTFQGSGDATRLYRRWTFSALASVGLAIPVGGHELRAEVRGWTHLASATKDLGGGERARVVQLGLGALW